MRKARIDGFPQVQLWGNVAEIQRKRSNAKSWAKMSQKNKTKIKRGKGKTWLENVWMQIKKGKKNQSDPKVPVDPGES